MVKRGDTVLILPFAWIGLVGAWVVAGSFGLSGSREDLFVRAVLACLTPLVAGAFGWALGSLRVGAAARVLTFLGGTPFAGAVNGSLIGASLTMGSFHGASDSPPAAVVFGAMIGGGCGVSFLPALFPAFVAWVRVGRARPGSFVDRADRRAVAVITAGMGSLIAWAFWSKMCVGPVPRVVPRAVVVAGFVVGLVGLLEDWIEYRRVLGVTPKTRLVPLGASLLNARSAELVDFGIGDESGNHVIPAKDAYRDAPSVAAVILGDAATAERALVLALVRDAAVVATSLLFALWD
jgi:hypothetical protein